MKSTPTASYSVTLRVEYPQQAGSLGKILTTIGEAEGDIGAIDIVRMEDRQSVRDITVNARDSEHGSQICDAVDALPEGRRLCAPSGGAAPKEDKTPCPRATWPATGCVSPRGPGKQRV